MAPGVTTDASARPQPSRNATAEKLLDAVSDLMIERNSTDVSLSDLAQRSGVNAALVKYHYGNKEGLLLALLARDAEVQVSHLEYLLQQPISPTEKLKLHIAGIINAYYRFPYMNRLLHLLLHDSTEKAAQSVSHFFVKPLLDFQRRLLDEGVAAGEFKPVDPVFFYTHLIGACDHLFHGRHAMSRAAGVGEVTDEVRRQYIDHMIDALLGGMLQPERRRAAARN
ncbi:TetR family transcriptional regulator [Bradyrhizobium sp. 2TAF24]|uniref:TetR family transcriptional regulator n=1 Tax=Bradyrhizobium sp. 2TAF24 TaxID=3233011 RepID=UPI003F8EB2B7